MNSYERVMNRFAGKPVDRIPNFSIVMMFAAKQMGITYKEYLTDYRKLTDAVIYCHEQFGIDVLSAISDSMREAEGFGYKVNLHDDGTEEILERVINDICDIKKLKLFDPYSSKRTYDRIQAVGLLKEKACGAIPVMGWVEGALAQSCDVMPMQEVFVNLFDEPEAIKELLEICAEEEILFANAQIDAGADIIGIGDSVSSLVGPDLFRDFSFPYLKKIIDAVHEKGALAKLHICGNITAVLDQVALTGADMIDFDYMVDMEKGAEIIPKNVCICGNIDPVAVVLEGNPELIKKEVKKSASLCRLNNNCIAPGCEIPRDTDPANVLAIQEAIEDNC